jgi:tripartite-type tricarboxylate transporter receptor subunit TctC
MPSADHVPVNAGIDRRPDRLLLLPRCGCDPADREQRLESGGDLFQESIADPTNLASMHEQGFTDFDVNPWYGFFLPRGTPAPVVKRLREASVATMAAPSVQERLQELGYTLVSPDRRSSEHLQKFVESEIERWAAVIKTVGISPE